MSSATPRSPIPWDTPRCRRSRSLGEPSLLRGYKWKCVGMVPPIHFGGVRSVVPHRQTHAALLKAPPKGANAPTGKSVMLDTKEKVPDTPASPVELYCGLMLEVKSRTSFVHLFLLERKQGRSSLPYRIARELCALQLRLTFECIAIACLCANRHLVKKRELEKEWHAGEMMDQLDKIDRSIFPTTVTVDHDVIRDLDPQLVTKKKFKSIYGKLGGSLHGRVLRDVIGSQPSAPLGTWPKLVEEVPLDDVAEIHDTIVKWIQIHRIKIDGGEHLFRMIGSKGYPELVPLFRE